MSEKKYTAHKLQSLPDASTYRESPIHEMDARTKAYSRIMGHIRQVEEDLGGQENLSFNQRAVVELIAFYREWLGEQWKAWLEGRSKDFEIEKIVKVANSMRDLMNRVGMKRQAKALDLSDLKPEDD